jgi:hypothetical protein
MTKQNILIVPKPWTILIDRVRESVDLYVNFDITSSPEIESLSVALYDLVPPEVAGFIVSRLCMESGVSMHVNMLAPLQIQELDDRVGKVLMSLIRALSEREVEHYIEVSKKEASELINLSPSILCIVSSEVDDEGIKTKVLVPPELDLIHLGGLDDEISPSDLEKWEPEEDEPVH